MIRLPFIHKSISRWWANQNFSLHWKITEEIELLVISLVQALCHLSNSVPNPSWYYFHFTNRDRDSLKMRTMFDLIQRPGLFHPNGVCILHGCSVITIFFFFHAVQCKYLNPLGQDTLQNESLQLFPGDLLRGIMPWLWSWGNKRSLWGWWKWSAEAGTNWPEFEGKERHRIRDNGPSWSRGAPWAGFSATCQAMARAPPKLLEKW